MKIALAQINTTVGDFAVNASKILDYHRKAASLKADFVLTPELAITGYPPRDLLLRPSFLAGNLEALRQLSAEISSPPLIVGYVERNTSEGRPLRNAAAVIQNGRVTQRVFKTLLPTYDVFDEDRYFEPSTSNIPISLAGQRVGITLCEDIWNDENSRPSRLYHRDPVRELQSQGLDLIVNLSASPWHIQKEVARFRVLEALARKSRLPVMYCNAIGGNDELIFDGRSLALDAQGRLIAQAKAFQEELLIADLATSPIAAIPMEESSQLFQALSLGLRDYVGKCGFRSVLLGLSGGIDSALTACIAVAALGRDHVLGVALPSCFSSEGSIVDARVLAQNLGIRFELIPIQPQVEAFRSALAPLFAGRPEDATEENLQSRVRGVMLMALSNKFGSLLITTGNKSELATGYCTLYGDMCGGLAVISDLSKTQVYSLSRWINDHPESTGLPKSPIPVSSIQKAPSAELRPHQTDQDSLPPYDTLDRILEAYVEKHQSSSEMARSGIDEKLAVEWIRKIDFSEYKRRQAAPGLKVSDKAFGMGRRLPIAQRFREI